MVGLYLWVCGLFLFWVAKMKQTEIVLLIILLMAFINGNAFV